MTRVQVVYTKLADMRAKVWDEEDEDIQRPDEETIAEQTEKTRLALEKITESKVDSFPYSFHCLKPRCLSES